VTTRLPLETQTLYAELLEHLLSVQARRSVGRLKGSFTEKRIKGEVYLYFQASQPGGTTRQFYLGRKDARMERLMERFERDRADGSADVERVRRLSAQLRAGGATTTDAPSARVIHALADGGVFEAGGALVGTHAFVALGNMLGARWGTGALRTQDIDIGRLTERDIDVAVPDVAADVPSVLESLKMGFLPVPALDPRHPSTSFKVRGQALRLDLLCPQRGESDAPVFIERFNAAAQPLPYLDYLLESPERVLVLDADAALVSVPAPARFALHKLLVAPLRPAAMRAKAEKDVAQAIDVVEVLIEDRPGDLGLAWQALIGRGTRTEGAARSGLRQVERRRPAVHKALVAFLEAGPTGRRPRKPARRRPPR
jgi:hypothetical protein